MSTLPAFNVTLHHLAPDATKASYELPDVQLPDVSAKQVAQLIEAVTKIAPKVAYPTAPEMRIVSADGQYLVQVKEGRVRFSSWAVRAGGCDLTTEEIITTITGIEPVEPRRAFSLDMSPATQGPKRRWQIVLLVVAVLVTNGVTAWMLTRPAPNLLPQFRLLEEEPAKRLLASVAGTYETGPAESDRQLRIEKEGGVRWLKFGPKRSELEVVNMTAKAADSAGKPALVTDTEALIEIKDQLTVVLFGDTYRRTQP